METWRKLAVLRAKKKKIKIKRRRRRWKPRGAAGSRMDVREVKLGKKNIFILKKKEEENSVGHPSFLILSDWGGQKKRGKLFFRFRPELGGKLGKIPGNAGKSPF